MFKRVGLFLATNLAVLALASVVMSLLGVIVLALGFALPRSSASAARSCRC